MVLQATHTRRVKSEYYFFPVFSLTGFPSAYSFACKLVVDSKLSEGFHMEEKLTQMLLDVVL